MFITIILGRQKLKLLAVLTLAIVIIFLLLFALNFRGVSWVATIASERPLLPIYYVDTTEKKVAFTFDASWGAERTGQILDIMRENEVKATFFLTGTWAEKYPEWVKEIVAEGHEVGNHTYSHPHMSQLSYQQIEKELKKAGDIIYSLSGKHTALFRPPFGEYNDTVISAADSLGYKTIQWSIDSLDWKNLSKEAIVEKVTEEAHRGAIILFHNNGQNTPEALPEIIEFYHRNGYKIVPVSSLIYQSNYEIDPHSGAQRLKR